ncbi:MAG: hypothetical protein Q8R39_01335 [bacterium]|nr:hypothetical protein [bacterium]
MAVKKRLVSIWAHNPDEVAALLVKKRFSVNNVKNIEIVETQGFSRESGMREPYAPMLTMEPGDVYCVPYIGIPLLVIATLDNGEKGGRVLIRSIVVDGTVVKGPKKIAEKLCLKVRQTGQTRWQNQSTFTISFFAD